MRKHISPQIFRISSTALSAPSTGRGNATTTTAQRRRRLVALRLIHGNNASLDLTGREYFVTGVGNPGGGHDNIARVDLGLTMRVRNLHAITVKYLWNRRDATSTALGSRSQTRGTVGIFYTLLGQDRFGTVDWR